MAAGLRSIGFIFWGDEEEEERSRTLSWFRSLCNTVCKIDVYEPFVQANLILCRHGPAELLLLLKVVRNGQAGFGRASLAMTTRMTMIP